MNPQQRIFALVAMLFTLIWAGTALAQPQFPDRGTAPVLDLANIISPEDEAVLSQRLTEFEQRNQRQFVVATIPSLDGYDIADYGYQLGRHWGLGDTENDDGIILLVAPNERKVRIEVGYGLEHIIPDGLAYDIINHDILPRFKAGDMSGGVVAGADSIVRQLELPPEEAAAIAAQASQPRANGNDFPFGALFWIAIVFFFFVLPMLRGISGGRRHRGGAAGAVGEVILWTAINAAMNSGKGSGGDWGGFGGFGGGGGFSGGGGSFGGGGASGSW
jgi:uncharacterized protein